MANEFVAKKGLLVPSGNVGIGTNSPADALTIGDGTSSRQIGLYGASSGTAGGSSINVRNNGVTSIAIGNYSNIVGGAYNNLGSIYTFSDTLFLPSGNERMRITSAGNVGIGTSNPSRKLEVSQTGDAFICIRGNYANNSGLIFSDIDLSGDSCAIRNDRQNNALWFSTNGINSERMRITSTGEVLIGTTSSIFTTLGRCVFEIAGGTAGAIVSLKTNTNTMSYYFADTSDVYLSKVATTGGRLYLVNVSGGLYLTENATTWTSSSDERLKNITGIIDSAVDKLMTLRAVNFSWKSDNTSKENLGLIAQDVEKVFPQIIDKNKLAGSPNNPQKDETEYLGVRYQELIPILVKAIQELKQEIETLKNK